MHNNLSKNRQENHIAVKEQRAAAIFSFLLPGLGQVYQRHYSRGIGLFVAFSILACFGEARLLLPLAALLTSVEAYRNKKVSGSYDKKSTPRWAKWFVEQNNVRFYRKWLYSLVAGLGFILWFGLFAPVLYPNYYQVELNAQMDWLADEVREFHAKTGRFPNPLSQINESGRDLSEQSSYFPSRLVDPWGQPIQIIEVDNGFELRSSGPDKKVNTKDDFSYFYK